VSLPPIRSERPVFDERLRRAGIDPRGDVEGARVDSA